MQVVILVTPATVVHDSSIQVNDGFWSRDHVLPIDKVLTIFVFQGQISCEPALVFSFELSDFDVCCSCWDFHNICVALTEIEKYVLVKKKLVSFKTHWN